MTDEVAELADKKAELFALWQGSSGQSKEKEVGLQYKSANKACIKATREAKKAFWSRKGTELDSQKR